MERYDLIVIGGGPGGYLAAQRAAECGMKVTLFEKNKLGGTCLNEGCIPTKTLLHSAKIYEDAKEGKPFGIAAENLRISHEEVIDRKDRVVQSLVSGVRMTMRRKKVTVISEQAMMIGKTKDGFSVQAGSRTYTGKNVILATGSEAVMPKISGLEEALAKGLAVTSREILKERELPDKLAIVGAGVIGLEFAAYFAALGAEVQVVETLDKIAGGADEEVSGLLQKALESKGVRFFLQCRATRITERGLYYEKEGREKLLAADKILLSIGRKPCFHQTGIRNVGLKAEQGRIRTDSHMETSVKGVYAVGDVNGASMLAHTAYREAEAAVHHIQGVEDEMDYTRIPSVIYTSPEAAWVGETEKSAKEKGMSVVTAKLPLVYAGRFVAENEGTAGICKLVAERGSGKLLGAHLLGPYASEMIWGMVALMEKGAGADEIKKMIFPHPTVSEIIKETIMLL